MVVWFPTITWKSANSPSTNSTNPCHEGFPGTKPSTQPFQTNHLLQKYESDFRLITFLKHTPYEASMVVRGWVLEKKTPTQDQQQVLPLYEIKMVQNRPLTFIGKKSVSSAGKPFLQCLFVIRLVRRCPISTIYLCSISPQTQNTKIQRSWSLTTKKSAYPHKKKTWTIENVLSSSQNKIPKQINTLPNTPIQEYASH